MHILVIDDDVPTREALTDVLEAEGHIVSVAANGRDALDMLGRMAMPDVALLDMMMPVMTGWEFLEAARKTPALGKLKVVIVSAASPALIETTGARAIVRKPLDLEHLLAVLNEVGAPSVVH